MKLQQRGSKLQRLLSERADSLPAESVVWRARAHRPSDNRLTLINSDAITNIWAYTYDGQIFVPEGYMAVNGDKMDIKDVLELICQYFYLDHSNPKRLRLAGLFNVGPLGSGHVSLQSAVGTSSSKYVTNCLTPTYWYSTLSPNKLAVHVPQISEGTETVNSPEHMTESYLADRSIRFIQDKFHVSVPFQGIPPWEKQGRALSIPLEVSLAYVAAQNGRMRLRSVHSLNRFLYSLKLSPNDFLQLVNDIVPDTWDCRWQITAYASTKNETEATIPVPPAYWLDPLPSNTVKARSDALQELLTQIEPQIAIERYNKLEEFIQEVGLGVFIGEGRESVDLLVDAIYDVIQLIRSISTRKPPRLKSVRFKKGALGKLEGLVNLDLMWKFGVKPLMNDIQELLNLVLKDPALINARKLRVDIFQKDITNNETAAHRLAGDYQEQVKQQNSLVSKVIAKSTMTVSYREVAFFEVASPAQFLLAQLGLHQLFEVLWEIFPLSFVVDWFLNISDLLKDKSLDRLGVKPYRIISTVSLRTELEFQTYEGVSIPRIFTSMVRFERSKESLQYIIDAANDFKERIRFHKLGNGLSDAGKALTATELLFKKLR